ncbi:DUF305 domain-containing protein [Actinotalea sp.]|uniref:DUF305 domain-containing protein n=1 Tax=Actinotalea sp. TaxID=1872145 RepID=UPI0035677B82
MMTARTSARLASLVALAALLTACGSAPATPIATSTPAGVQSPAAEADEHNEADATFAQMMIIHHQGAIEMAELAVTSAASDEVRSLAERIAAAQGPEIEQMSRWLDGWGEDQPDTADMTGMGHAGMQMEGMDQSAVMAELATLAGADFDRRFLQLMIEHHRGAIEMAEDARAQGVHPDALRLAGRIIDAQSIEITEMDNLLRSR